MVQLIYLEQAPQTKRHYPCFYYVDGKGTYHAVAHVIKARGADKAMRGAFESLVVSLSKLIPEGK